MAPTLLVLAAGMGSRYGGLKQIDPVGPSGETILDYSVYDALRAGFGRVVFVIRRDFEGMFRERVGARYGDRIEIDYAFQAVTDLPEGFSCPPGREKPWGTGHAVWCARAGLKGAFAAINADDFYGADAFVRLAAFLEGSPPSATAMVGFRMKSTLSEFGSVSRGVCSIVDSELKGIVEQTGITPEQVGPGRLYTGEEIVSMNCWGFGADFIGGLDERLRHFLAKRVDEPKAEFYLPTAVSDLVAEGRTRVQVLPTEASWFGVTYREDRPRVAESIAELVAAGLYPPTLF